MRILMFSHGYLPTLSGVTLVVQKIARAMVERGHEVVIITASEKHWPYQSADQGVGLQRVWGVPNPFWWEGPMPIMSPHAIQKFVSQFQPDIIHTHENAVMSLTLGHMHWDKRPAIISSCYALPRYVTYYLNFWGLEKLVEAITWKYYVGVLNRYDHVVFCTRTHERDFCTHGLRPPTTVISNGVNLQRYHPEKQPGENIENHYDLPAGARILSVGRLMKDKKLHLLIRAMREVCNQQEAHLLVVGRGSERPRLKALIRRLNLEPYIHLLGYVPEQDLPALYRACNLFAIPSMVEVQSLPALQAAVTGLPIVAANSAALPELVRHGENGFLVNPLDGHQLGDAILHILSNPSEAARMGQVSLEIGREHDEQLTFRAYDEFYQRMAINNHKRS
ncbi:MAG TPA: glycosyltransferase [Anaerolineales bacterium]|nr:glycosyltransferase [Anaerolineales bacterium]